MKGRTRRANGKPEESPPGPRGREDGPQTTGRKSGIWGRTHYEAVGKVLPGLRNLRMAVRQLPGCKRSYRPIPPGAFTSLWRTGAAAAA